MYVCERGEKIQRPTEGSKSLMFFPGPLAVLIKMLMDLCCACIYFYNCNAGEKSIKLKCFFSRVFTELFYKSQTWAPSLNTGFR